MMVRTFASLPFAIWVALSLVSLSANAGPVVSEGVRLTFSPRGQSYFETNLGSVLLANQIDLSKNHWDEIKFVLDEPFKGSDLIQSLHDRFAPYFYGFPVHPPKLEVAIAGADLGVKFKVVGAVVDPAGPAAYGKAGSNGTIILMRLEAEGLQFDAKTLRLNDLANPDLLGVLGADSVSAKSSDGNLRTMKAELPVLFEANGSRATMKVLAVRTNLQKHVFELSLENLLTPSIKMVINGKEYAFDQAAFERDLRAEFPKLSEALAVVVKKYFEKDGMELIQPQFDELAKSLNIGFTIPLLDDPAFANDLTVNLRPKTTEYSRAHLLSLSFDLELSDQKFADGKGIFATPGSSGRATLKGVDASTYDVALTVHPAAINGVLNRAWAKGALHDIEMGADDSGHPTKVKIPQPPIIAFDRLPKSNQARIHAWVGYVVRGLGGILFKGPIPIELDLMVNLETNAKNEIEVVLDHIDESTLKVDTRAAWLWPIRTLVGAMVRDKISALNKDATTKRQIITSIPTLDELVGVPLKLDAAKTQAGNLVLLADFAPKP